MALALMSEAFFGVGVEPCFVLGGEPGEMIPGIGRYPGWIFDDGTARSWSSWL